MATVENEIEYKPGIFDRIKEYLGNMTKELQNATVKDKLIDQKAQELKVPNFTPSWDTRKKWFMKYWWVFLVGFVLIIGIFQATEPKRRQYGSHHKYDADGRLIY